MLRLIRGKHVHRAAALARCSSGAAYRSVFRDGLFAGRCAVITGGGSGIGRQIARELLELGCNVVIASRDEGKIAVTRNELAAEVAQEMAVKAADANGPSAAAACPGEVAAVRCNIRKEEDCEALMEDAAARFGNGRVDFLVNNGGGQFLSPAAHIPKKGWGAVIETNLTGTFLCSKAAYTHGGMRESGGTIVNIIADMWKGFPGMAHTGAARAGVDNLTKTLAVEWARAGVRVNSVAPGVIYSASAQANYARVPGASMALTGQWPSCPAKRVGTTEEVSAAVCFLLSPAAAFISGETLKVDGAASLYRSNSPDIADHDAIPAFGREQPPKPSLEQMEALGASDMFSNILDRR